MIEINSTEQLENIVEEGFSNRQKQTQSKTKRTRRHNGGGWGRKGP